MYSFYNPSFGPLCPLGPLGPLGPLCPLVYYDISLVLLQLYNADKKYIKILDVYMYKKRT